MYCNCRSQDWIPLPSCIHPDHMYNFFIMDEEMFLKNISLVITFLSTFSMQWKIINSVLNDKRDNCVIMATGRSQLVLHKA